MVRLGGSIRRRRGREEGTGHNLRSLVVGGGVLLVGLLIGYLVSTQLLFPAPAPPDDLVTIPDLHGLSEDEAHAAAREAGLTPRTDDQLRHPTLAEGQVVGQSPVPGQRVIPGDTLSLTLSLGPELRPVPDVSRVRTDRARTVLEATGFTVVVDSVESDYPRGTILFMEPGAGVEMALPGEVTLGMSLGPPRVQVPVLVGLSPERAYEQIDSLGLVVSDVRYRMDFAVDDEQVVEQEPDPSVLVERGAAVDLVIGSPSGEFGNIRLPGTVENPAIAGDSPSPLQPDP